MTWVWGLLAAAALLWPDRISSPLDGVPLDRVVEAVLVGAVFPALCLVHPRFLARRFPRACIVVLLLWKAGAAATLAQDGWCVRFVPARPFAKDAMEAPHAWDVRADWLAANPACSAIMSRPYRDFAEFPAWFFNLPPPSDSWPAREDRPPDAVVAMQVRGYLDAAEPGILQIDTGRDMNAVVAVDGRVVQGETNVSAGSHAINIDARLTGDDWRLVPLWNGGDLWSRTTATMRRPSTADVVVRRYLGWLPAVVVLALQAAWLASALADIASAPVLIWTISSSLTIAALVQTDRLGIARWIVPALAGAMLLPVPPRFRGMRGAALLIGVPWITFVVVCSMPAVGRFVLYDVGSDAWMYQRYAYRIVMQGYWLEGGSPTFWFQPFYRWIAGALHVMFGDSHAGEWYWDGASLLAGALLSFRITWASAGFRWALAAGAAPLAVFVLGTTGYLMGSGLSEISSTGLLSAAALYAVASRRGGTAGPVVAGLLATLAFFTRLNNLPMALAVSAFAIPPGVAVRAVLHPRSWLPQVSWRSALTVLAIVAAGVVCFAWRTWHYTGVFSVFYGTQRNLLAVWKPGMSVADGIRASIASVLMVLTTNDPPRFDVYALPVLAGAATALLAVAGAPRFRDVPLAPVLFFFSGLAGAFVARGSAYPGRFSVHIIPVACALAACGAERALRHAGPARRQSAALQAASTS